MKWALPGKRIEELLGSHRKKHEKNAGLSKTLDALHQKGNWTNLGFVPLEGAKTFRPWAQYTIPDFYLDDPELQRKYEILCGGWLEFFDTELSKNTTDFVLKVSWDFDKKVVYLEVYNDKEDDTTGGWKPFYGVISPGGIGDPPKPPPPPPPYA